MPMPIPPEWTPEHLLAQIRKAKKAGQFYYTEEKAGYVKRLLDVLHERKEPLFIQAGDSSLNTLRVQYYQGRDYLLDHMDDSGHYKALAELTELKVKPNGLLFLVRHAPKGKATLLDFATFIPEWRQRLEHFLENAGPNKKFHLEGLALTDKDKAFIDGKLSTLVKFVDGQPIPLFFGEVTDDSILLVRDED